MLSVTERIVTGSMVMIETERLVGFLEQDEREHRPGVFSDESVGPFSGTCGVETDGSRCDCSS